MIAWLVIVAVAGLALSCVRTAPPVARLVAWCVVLGFALAAADPRQVAFAEVEARPVDAAASADVQAVLRAAAAAGPRAADLSLRWREPLAAAPGQGPIGARAVLPTAPLPIDPRRVQVRALGDLAVGRPLLLQVEAPGLEGAAGGELVLRRDGAEVARLPFTLAAGAAAECDWLPDAAGRYTLACELRAFGHRLLGEGAFEVGVAPRVLVLDPSGVAAAALRAQGLAIDSADALPPDWRQRPALVLGLALPAEQQQAVVAAVLDGLGVFALAPAFGGEDAPLRALLPLRPLPPADAPAEPGGVRSPDVASTPPPAVDDGPPGGQTGGAAPVGRDPIEVDKRSIAMVLVVDRSGSMGSVLRNGLSKMSYAKTSALRTAQALGEGDQVALVTFGSKDAGRVELPLTDATALATVRRGIDRLAHGPEDTFLLGGLRRANELLAASRAAVKHIVVITDGEFRVEESLALKDLAMRMRTDGRATLSVVSIIDAGTDPSFTREAELLTRAGGGQFLPIEDATFVPVLVSAEVTRALSRVGREPAGPGTDPTARPEPPKPDAPAPPPVEPPPENPAARLVVRAVANSPLLAPATEHWPTLGGAVPGTAPLDAQVLLVAGEHGWPLLAFANRGLGRSGAFAADLGGADGAGFRADPAFPGRFAQWVQAVSPPAPAPRSEPLLGEVRVEPAVPTQRDVEWLSALGGAPVVVDAPPPPPALARTVVQEAPQWALVLLLALVALALCERYAGLWSLQRARTP
jgi:Mg-chelatase subunit ChlD